MQNNSKSLQRIVLEVTSSPPPISAPKSLSGNRLTSVRTHQSPSQKKFIQQLTKFNPSANQFLLSRGDPSEPCFQCVNKILRSNNMSIAKQFVKQKSRDELQPHVVILRTSQDLSGNQRCLFLDKQNNQEKPIGEYQNELPKDNLLMMQQEILQKQMYLQFIDNNQKVTAQEVLNDTYPINKTEEVQSQSAYEKNKLSSLNDASSANKESIQFSKFRVRQNKQKTKQINEKKIFQDRNNESLKNDSSPEPLSPNQPIQKIKVKDDQLDLQIPVTKIVLSSHKGENTKFSGSQDQKPVEYRLRTKPGTITNKVLQGKLFSNAQSTLQGNQAPTAEFQSQNVKNIFVQGSETKQSIQNNFTIQSDKQQFQTQKANEKGVLMELCPAHSKQFNNLTFQDVNKNTINDNQIIQKSSDHHQNEEAKETQNMYQQQIKNFVESDKYDNNSAPEETLKFEQYIIQKNEQMKENKKENLNDGSEETRINEKSKDSFKNISSKKKQMPSELNVLEGNLLEEVNSESDKESIGYQTQIKKAKFSFQNFEDFPKTRDQSQSNYQVNKINEMKQIVENTSNQFQKLEKIINQQSQKNMRLVYSKKNSLYQAHGQIQESKILLHTFMKQDESQAQIDQKLLVNKIDSNMGSNGSLKRNYKRSRFYSAKHPINKGVNKINFVFDNKNANKNVIEQLVSNRTVLINANQSGNHLQLTQQPTQSATHQNLFLSENILSQKQIIDSIKQKKLRNEINLQKLKLQQAQIEQNSKFQEMLFRSKGGFASRIKENPLRTKILSSQGTEFNYLQEQDNMRIQEIDFEDETRLNLQSMQYQILSQENSHKTNLNFHNQLQKQQIESSSSQRNSILKEDKFFHNQNILTKHADQAGFYNELDKKNYSNYIQKRKFLKTARPNAQKKNQSQRFKTTQILQSNKDISKRSQEALEIPHPNLNSNFFDRIMARNQQKETQVLSFQNINYTNQDCQSMQNPAKLNIKRLQKIPRYKQKQQIESYIESAHEESFFQEDNKISLPQFYKSYKEQQNQYTLISFFKNDDNVKSFKDFDSSNI